MTSCLPRCACQFTSCCQVALSAWVKRAKCVTVVCTSYPHVYRDYIYCRYLKKKHKQNKYTMRHPMLNITNIITYYWVAVVESVCVSVFRCESSHSGLLSSFQGDLSAFQSLELAGACVPQVCLLSLIAYIQKKGDLSCMFQQKSEKSIHSFFNFFKHTSELLAK